MGFPPSIADEVLVKCGRHCCLCGKYAGLKMELHHIKQVADGGEDTADNCIPLCLDCHAEVGSYNPHHPKGRKYTEKELKGHRDKYYAMFSNMPDHIEQLQTESAKSEPLFAAQSDISVSSWGYSSLDKMFALLPGKLVLVAGYTGTRKSTYVQQIVNTNLRKGQRIAYCCLKDHPLDTSYDIIAEDAFINSHNIKQGKLREQDWIMMCNSELARKGENLAIFPADRMGNTENLLNLVETSGAEIVVIDDLNGLFLENPASVERFMYRLRNIAARSQTIVFIIYNMSPPKKRGDMRPMLEDFPSDSYYRLCDYVHFLFKPAVYYSVDSITKNTLELIVAKGFPGGSITIEMNTPDEITGVIEVERRK